MQGFIIKMYPLRNLNSFQTTRSHGKEGPTQNWISQPEPGSKAALRNRGAVMVCFCSRGPSLMGLSYSPRSCLHLSLCPPLCQLQLAFSLLFYIPFSASWRASSQLLLSRNTGLTVLVPVVPHHHSFSSFTSHC